MIHQAKKLLTELKNIELHEKNHKQIRELLLPIVTNNFGTQMITLHPGKEIIRGRPHKHVIDRFEERSQLSYKPQNFNTTYQRASTPNRTMFYGAFAPDLQSETEPLPRQTIIREVDDFFCDKDTFGLKKVTFSLWQVLQNLNLVAIVSHEKFERESLLFRELNSGYHRLIQQQSRDVEMQLAISKFLGHEFAKEVDRNHHERYMISAIFSEIITDLGFDGVIYPSYRMGGHGLNIALTPFASDYKIQLSVASESMSYKVGKYVLTNNETFARYHSGRSLKYQSLRFPYRQPDELCRLVSGLTRKTANGTSKT